MFWRSFRSCHRAWLASRPVESPSAPVAWAPAIQGPEKFGPQPIDRSRFRGDFPCVLGGSVEGYDGGQRLARALATGPPSCTLAKPQSEPENGFAGFLFMRRAMDTELQQQLDTL